VDGDLPTYPYLPRGCGRGAARLRRRLRPRRRADPGHRPGAAAAAGPSTVGAELFDMWAPIAIAGPSAAVICAASASAACPMSPLAAVISATRPLNGPSMTASLSHQGDRPLWRRSGRKAPGDDVIRPRRCMGSQPADHHISSLPPAGLCRDDRPGHQSRLGVDAPSARGYTRCRRVTKRHRTAPGFTDSV
jgi:hypothetical protein